MREFFRRNTVALGIFCVMGAVLSFTTADMMIKSLSGGYPLHEIVFVRACVAIAVTVAILMPLEGGLSNLKSKRLPLHILRGLTVVLANMSFFFGLATLPLGEATAIFFIAPLCITALSVPFLGEKVGIRRWMAVAVGLVGVIIIIRPGTEAFHYAAFGPILAALAYASMQIMARKLGVTEKASTMAFYIQFTFLIVCSVIGLSIGDGRYAVGIDDPSLEFVLRAWIIPEESDFWIMVAVGCLSAVGAYLISQGYRLVEATVAAPFEYIALPMAIFWSVTVFGDWPDWIAFIGIALILSSGLYAFWRENVRGTDVATKHPLPRNR